MGSNVVFFAWNRSVPGREQMSAEHFGEFVGYLTGLQQNGTIQSFDTVFLGPHGGDMNGFFLIRAESGKLDSLLSTTEWVTHMTRAEIHLQGAGFVRGHTGEMVQEMFNIWSSLIPA
jgi:hypothetical protein